MCEGEGEITAPPRRAVPSREPRELGRAGEGEPDRRLLPGEPGEGSGAGTAGKRPLGCPRPAGGARGGTGRSRRAPPPPGCQAWRTPRPLHLRPRLPGAGGEPSRSSSRSAGDVRGQMFGGVREAAERSGGRRIVPPTPGRGTPGPG